MRALATSPLRPVLPNRQSLISSQARPVNRVVIQKAGPQENRSSIISGNLVREMAV